MTDEKLKSFEFHFQVMHIKADTRDFRQDSDSLCPMETLKVCVLLPRENEYVYNLSDISLKELSGEDAPEPVLTPKGFAYVKKALEAGFEMPKLEVTEDAWVETEKKLSPEKVKDTWTDPDWGAGKLKPETEPWNEAEAGSWE